MGLQDKIVAKAAENISGQSDKLFKDIIRIQESMHGYLEKLLACQRLILYELEEKNGSEHFKWVDEEQT